MDQAALRRFESLCTQEEPPGCRSMCPLHVDARGFLDLMSRDKTKDARKLLERSMPLSGLTGLLCEGSCMPHCVRYRVDSPVQVPLVERACIAATQASKPFPLPDSGKKVAVAGSSLSGLCAAWELAKKGHQVTVFHQGVLGADLASLPEDTLPAAALAEALEQLAALRTNFVPAPSVCDISWVQSLPETYAAIYIGLDDPTFFADKKEIEDVYSPVNLLTLETLHPAVFCGGGALSRIHAAAEGKRAAGSIDRVLQGVAPSSAREHEGVYPSTLYTSTDRVEKVPPVVPQNPLRPSLEEGQAEAARCIVCQCLECVKVCPYLAHYKGYPKKYAREIYNNLSVIHGLRRANQTINSCALCGLCAVICPNNAHMGEFCALARQTMVKDNRMPPSAHEFALEDMQFSNSAEAAFLRHQPGFEHSSWLFFPGCQLPASVPQQTKALYEHLCNYLQGGVGFMSGCCGAPAKWSGRERLARSAAQTLRSAWESMDKPTVLAACASCLEFLRKELPEIPCRSVWEELSNLPLPQTAASIPVSALHDPCASREDDTTRTRVRFLLQQIGQQAEELALGGATTRCCGYGGLASAANPVLAEEYAGARAEDTCLPLIAYCIMCRDRIASAGKECLHLLDLLFPQGPFVQALLRPAPGISTRRENRSAFKRHMLETLWQEKAPLPPKAEFTFSCPPEVEQKLEERRICRADIYDVLAHARQHGALFFHGASRRFLAALRPRQVTFWVEYEETGQDAYCVHDAYCHRMVAPGVDGEGLPSPCTLEGYAAKGGRL